MSSDFASIGDRAAGIRFQNRCEYVHVRCVGDVPVADAFENGSPLLCLRIKSIYFVAFMIRSAQAAFMG